MILSEYICSDCGEPACDSTEYCPHCHHRYNKVLARIARAHHEAKLNLSGRCRTSKDMEWRDACLSAVLQCLMLFEKNGVRISGLFITQGFEAIQDEF